MDKEKELVTLEEIRIYSDPYRLQIMDEFFKIDRPATIKEVADAMHEVPAKVYYHAKKLEKIGLLELVDTKLINGITAKYFEPFQGKISIKKAKIDHAIQDAFMSKTQSLINNLFDGSKQRFLASANSEKLPGHLFNRNVYLTKGEVEELFQRIHEFCETKSKKRSFPSDEDIELYEIFFSMIKKAADEKQ